VPQAIDRVAGAVVLLDEVVLDARAGGGPEDGGEVEDAVANLLELGFPR